MNKAQNAKDSKSSRPYSQYGLTLIQMMIIFLLAGIAGGYALDRVIEQRCKEDPARQMCQDRQ